MQRLVGESLNVGLSGGHGGEDGVQGGVGMGMEFVVQIPPLDNAYPNAGSTGPSRAVVASAQLPASGMGTALLPHVPCSNTASPQVTVYSESGNYCSQSPPSRRASVVPTQILVYEALISCLKDACDTGIPGRSPRDAQLRTTLDGYLLSMASENVVSGIVQSVEYLKILLELSVELGLANDSKLRMALHKDGERIATLLMSIFASKSLEEAVLRLEGDSAQCFLDVVQNTLDKGFLFAQEDGRMARRIIRKLACSSDKLPSALFITGITGKEEHPTFGGGFADIYRASYDNRMVALKYMRITQYMRGSALRKVRLKFCREALVWKELCHPHILPFLGIEENTFPSPLSMVSPWMEHGTVLNYLKQHGHSNVDKLLYEIAQGLQYLHSRNIVHGDLRGANILINDDWSACLADFGLSIFSDTTSLLTTNRGGSAYWMAPELLDPDRFGMRFARTPASDVYSFGCVCLELYTGRPPFSGILPEPGAMMKVINGERPPRPSSSPAMSDSLWNYVSMYWAQDPKIRPVMQIVTQNMIWPQPPEEECPTKDPYKIADKEQNQQPSNLGQTYSELLQAIFDRSEILEEDAFLRTKSDPTAPRAVATMTVEEQWSSSVGGHIADNPRNATNLLFQIDPDEISSSSGPQQAQDQNYTDESHLQPIRSDSIQSPHDPWSTYLPSSSDRSQSSFVTHRELPRVEDYRAQSDNDSKPDPHNHTKISPVPGSISDNRSGGESKGLSSSHLRGQLDGNILSIAAKNNSPSSPLLSLACRFLPHDQWFTTHIDPNWKVKQVKSWFLAKCLPNLSESEPQPPPEEILPPIPPPKKRAILPTASTSARRDLYSQYTLIRFSTGQLLEDHRPLRFYNMQADELLEVHRVGIIVTLPRAHPTRYLDAYWEGRVRVLRMKPLDDEEDSYPLYKVRQLETRALEWRERWLVVREGSIHLCRDETRLIHTLSLADLVELTNTGIPPYATPSNKTRVLLARFSRVSSPLVSTRASSPINPFGSDSSSDLYSPIFAHDSSDSNRPRRKLHGGVRKRADPEYLILDLKDDAAYVSLLRVLHRYALPRSTFVDKLPLGTAELRKQSPRSALSDNEDTDDDAPPLRHPSALTHLRIPPRSFSFGALPFPEWRINVLQRARQAGLGRMGKALEWVLWSGETPEDPAWMLDSISPVRSRRRRRRQHSPVKQPTSSDGCDSDIPGDTSPSLSDNGEDDSDSENAGARSETEWVGWMGDLRRQAQVAMEERARAAAQEEARRLVEETRDAELELPPLPPGSAAEVTIAFVGTGDDRQWRAALEPSATVTGPSGETRLLQAHLPHGPLSLSSGTYNESPSSMSKPAAPVPSSPSSTEPLAVAFSPLALPVKLADAENMLARTTWVQPPQFDPAYHIHSGAQFSSSERGGGEATVAIASAVNSTGITGPNGLSRVDLQQQASSPPQTPPMEQVVGPSVPIKEKMRGRARGASIVKSLNSALDFVVGR